MAENPASDAAKLVATVGVFLLFIGAVVGLVALWWWAIAGLSHPVALAAAITSGSLLFSGVVFIALASE